MTHASRRLHSALTCFLFVTSLAYAQSVVRYTASLAQPAAHLVHVKIDLPPGPAERELQMPVWNALYQVRDFSQYINWIKATNSTGQRIALTKLDKSRWRITGAESGGQIEYEIYTDEPGPYGAQFNEHHAFFNLAEVLMYTVDARASSIRLKFTGIPPTWKIATALPEQAGEYLAENYDRMVDSPVEIGEFQETDIDEGGGHYRIVIDANSTDYNLQKLVPQVRGIAAAETAWMNDRPFETYLFIYHFPRAGGGGGMEHAYGTAIDVNAQRLTDDPLAFAEVTAHEFFHLWNVKRIRPQSLEPIDYSKENYTTSLWFSEGFTDTVQNYALLRAGLLNEQQYLAKLAATFTEIGSSPSHLTQSVEESSRDAWLEKYAYYRLPQRSISYYHKGDLLGVMLDLEVREASHGEASLRDVFQWMNQNYAKQGRFFADTEGVRQAAEAVSHANLEEFFRKYVSSTDELPTDTLFRTVGLQLVLESRAVPDVGFAAVRNFSSPPTVVSVTPGSAAEQAGLRAGDSMLEMEGRPATQDLVELVANLRAGDTLRLKVRNAKSEHELHWKIGSREAFQYAFKELDNVTPQQKARRAAWLKGESQPQ